jgi:hypothetical protein
MTQIFGQAYEAIHPGKIDRNNFGYSLSRNRISFGGAIAAYCEVLAPNAYSAHVQNGELATAFLPADLFFLLQ